MARPSISLDPEAGALILRYRLASISQEQLRARQKPSANNRRLLPSTRAGLARSSHDGSCEDRASATCAPALAQQSDSRALPRTSPKLHRNARAGRDRPGNKKPARQRVIEGASAGRRVLWGTSGSPEDAGGRGGVSSWLVLVGCRGSNGGRRRWFAAAESCTDSYVESVAFELKKPTDHNRTRFFGWPRRRDHFSHE